MNIEAQPPYGDLWNISPFYFGWNSTYLINYLQISLNCNSYLFCKLYLNTIIIKELKIEKKNSESIEKLKNIFFV